jgi:cell division protein FtsQ
VNVLTVDEVRGLGGVDDTTNVVHVDREAVVGRLEASPWVADASVLVELPDTLELRITERRPIGLIDALGEHGVLANDATVLPMTPGVPEGLPAVRAALGAPSESQRQAAAAILMAIDPVVSKRVSALTVGQDGLVTLTLTSGTTVRTGAAGDEAAKAEALRAVLRWASSDDLELTSIDVSAPTAPSATLSDGSTLTP